MINNVYSNTLRVIYDKLENSNIKWFLIGKTNLALQGIDIVPSHLGIVFHHKYLQQSLDLFKGYEKTKIVKTDNCEAEEYTFMIDDIKIMMCAEYSQGAYIVYNKNPLIINVEDMKIPCVCLEDELEAYKQMKIIKTAKIIEEYLEK